MAETSDFAIYRSVKLFGEPEVVIYAILRVGDATFLLLWPAASQWGQFRGRPARCRNSVQRNANYVWLSWPLGSTVAVRPIPDTVREVYVSEIRSSSIVQSANRDKLTL